MFRLHDWECTRCGTVSERVIKISQDDPVPRELEMECAECDGECWHNRRISRPAPHMGKKVLNVAVHGGSFDTMGYKSEPELPPPLPPDAKWGDWKDRWHSKEYKEIKAAKMAVKKENKAKRARAAAIKRGENINMRTCKLPGDPNFSS